MRNDCNTFDGSKKLVGYFSVAQILSSGPWNFLRSTEADPSLYGGGSVCERIILLIWEVGKLSIPSI
jgi:hypothetical protein